MRDRLALVFSVLVIGAAFDSAAPAVTLPDRYFELLAAEVPELAQRFVHEGVHEAGPTQPIPLDRLRYVHRLRVPAGIRKSGPWVVGLAGLVSTQAVTGRYYLDLQASLSGVHERIG